MTEAALAQAAAGILATLLAIILHELAHGLAALALGDTTARDAGRLTLNPLRHVDRVGTLLLPAVLAVSQLATIGRIAFMFGWAKPVPVNPLALHVGTLHNPRRLMALVAIAGPLMNFALAFAAAFALYAGQFTDFLTYFILVNLLLGLFNLLPLPPMDGGRIAVGLLPLGAARRLAGAERYGILFVLLLLFILPTAAAQFGLRFNPLQDVLSVVLPWAGDTVMRLTGHGHGL
jgi:Zn-dependent protease